MSTDGWRLEHTYLTLPALFFRAQAPEPAPAPRMALWNRPLAEELGLNAEALEKTPEQFAGRTLPRGAKPIAQAYAGYQFGHLTKLGDGRAILLGEQITPTGARVDIQRKGAGRTPYSRGGDGRAALGPMLREYIVSEAMAALGIPTTRSLAVVLTGERVVRDRVQQGAVLTRVAASHIRVGTFDYAAAFGGEEDVRRLADYSIWRHGKEPEEAAYDGQNKYRLLLQTVAERQAKLIAAWQLVGFVHGVMNTDNMAISGETIDYGPCAFLDAYDPAVVFSSIDVAGRYAYQNQPAVGAWNLYRFAKALLPLLDPDRDTAMEQAVGAIDGYWDVFHRTWNSGMCEKIGILREESGDEAMVSELLDLMARHALDYTGTFRALSNGGRVASPLVGTAEGAVWMRKWRDRLSRQPQGLDAGLEKIRRVAPAVIPRNHRVEEAIQAAEEGDFSVVDRLLGALGNPYAEHAVYSAVPERTACKYQTFCGT